MFASRAPMRTIHLLIPRLFPTLIVRSHPFLEPFFSSEIKTLQRFLSRFACIKNERRGIERHIIGLFGLDLVDDIPAGKASSALLHTAGKHPYWLRADPAIFTTGTGGVTLLGNTALGLDRKDAYRYAEAIAPIFHARDMGLSVVSPTEWALNVPEKPDFHSEPFWDVVGSPIHQFLPRNKAFHPWQALLTEVQTELHHLDINIKRREAHQPTLNGLWFWGGGEHINGATDFKTVIGNDTFTKGLATANQCATLSLPSGILSCMEVLDEGNILINLDILRPPVMEENFEAWNAQLKNLVELWLEPLEDVLLSQKNIQLILDPMTGERYQGSGKNLNAWWKPVKPLSAFLPEKSLFTGKWNKHEQPF